MWARVRKVAVLGWLTALFLTLAPPMAYAEGSFESHLSNVRPGFGSRQWTKNTHGPATRILHSGCDRTTVTYTVRRIAWWGGWEDLGSVRYGCGGSRDYSYGTMGTGQYSFYVRAINDNPYVPTAGMVNVPWLKVVY